MGSVRFFQFDRDDCFYALFFRMVSDRQGSVGFLV